MTTAAQMTTDQMLQMMNLRGHLMAAKAILDVTRADQWNGRADTLFQRNVGAYLSFCTGHAGLPHHPWEDTAKALRLDDLRYTMDNPDGLTGDDLAGAKRGLYDALDACLQDIDAIWEARL